MAEDSTLLIHLTWLVLMAHHLLLQVFLMRNRDATNSSKGCGFVKYKTRDEAQRAINALNGNLTDGEAPQPIQVASQPACPAHSLVI